MTIDPFANYASGPTSAYNSALEVFPDDDNDLPVIPRAFNMVKTTGVYTTAFPLPITVTLMNDEVVTLGLTCGRLYKLRIKRLHATGTPDDVKFTILW